MQYKITYLPTRSQRMADHKPICNIPDQNVLAGWRVFHVDPASIAENISVGTWPALQPLFLIKSLLFLLR